MRKIKRQLLDDRLFLWHARAYRKPYFHDGVDSPPLADHLDALEFELPPIGKLGRTTFEASTLVGDLVGAIHIQAYAGPTAPVLIYHHEGEEIPPARTLKQIFPASKNRKLSIVMVEAPFHDSAAGLKVARSSVAVYLAMLAVSIAATERVLSAPLFADSSLSAVAGFGQGGFIANWHHMLFDSADLYMPFMAGTAQAELFLSTLPTAGRARRNPARLRALLNFDRQWAERRHGKVFPVLGSTDLINRFNDQAPSYGDTPIEVWPVAHVAATKDVPDRIRAKILRHIDAATAEREEHIIVTTPPVRHLMRARG